VLIVAGRVMALKIPFVVLSYESCLPHSNTSIGFLKKIENNPERLTYE
jgi:hypothetical protein